MIPHWYIAVWRINLMSLQYLPQPNRGGVFQMRDQTHDKATPPTACLVWNEIGPSGLLTTNILSMAIRATVHSDVIPAVHPSQTVQYSSHTVLHRASS